MSLKNFSSYTKKLNYNIIAIIFVTACIISWHASKYSKSVELGNKAHMQCTQIERNIEAIHLQIQQSEDRIAESTQQRKLQDQLDLAQTNLVDISQVNIIDLRTSQNSSSTLTASR